MTVEPVRPVPAPDGDHAPEFSVVVPVFNSEATVGDVVRRALDFFDERPATCEVILVNDGSSDNSWETIRALAEADDRIMAINLVRNYGQHNANVCGFREARGEWVITIDDDGQNPPEEIGKLIDKAAEGYEVVFGKFDVKHSGLTRRLGSRAIGLVNRRVFGQPHDLTVSNFRIIHRSVVDRIVAARTAYPYVTGQALLYSGRRANVAVRHEARVQGRSNYSLTRTAALVMTILFSYSSAPLHIMALVGAAMAALSFGLAALYVLLALIRDTDVEGWTTLVVLTAFLNGVVILLLSMLGEYTVRTLRQVTGHETFHVLERVRRER